MISPEILREMTHFTQNTVHRMLKKMELNISCSSSAANPNISSTSNSNESRIFQLVRPICIAIMKNPTCSNLHQLSSLLQDLPGDFVERQLVEYIVFPISVHLKTVDKLRQEVRISLHKCLQIILAKWEITSFVLFLELFHRLNASFGSQIEPTELNKELPEDVLEPVVLCLYGLVKSSLPYHFEQLYASKYIASIGHSIFMLLQIITYNTAISLRLAAINVLDVLVRSCAGNNEACHQMFKFLPGLASSLRKVCSLRPAKHQLELVLRGLSVFEITVQVSVSAETPTTLRMADINLSTVFKEISDSFLLNEKEGIRQSLMEFSIVLIEYLEGKMPICCEILWNNIFVLANDANSAVVEKCQEFLLSSPCSSKSERCNPTAVLNLAKQALGQIKSHDDNGCILSLKCMSSTLLLVQLPTEELNRFLQLLLNIISVSLASTTSRLLEIQLDLKKENILRLVCSTICSNLTVTSDLSDILDQLSDLLKDINSPDWVSAGKSAALIFVINNVIRSSTEQCSNGSHLSVRRMIEHNEVFATMTTYVKCLNAKPENVKLAPVTKLDKLQLATNASPKFELCHAVYTMNILEGLEILLAIDNGSLQSFLLPDVMYVLLEHAGRQDYPFVTNAALQTIQSISPEKSIETILADNLDLIMNELCVQIKRIDTTVVGSELSPRCPDAIIFLAKYFDFSQHGFVTFVEETFFRTQNLQEDGRRQVVYARLFFALISSLLCHSQRLEALELADKLNKHSPQEDIETKSLVNRLLDYQKSVGMSLEEEVEVPQSEDSEEQNPEVDDEGKTLPANPSLALRICHRVLHYLPLDNRNTKLLAMDILIKGAQVLTPHENSLLPLAHQIWDYLVPRFEESDYVVVRKSFELLLALCSASKNFLKKRTLVEVFPKLAVLLKKLGDDSSKVKDKNRVYYTSTQAYKLQLCMLQGMAELCRTIEVQERDLDKVADGCLTYLVPDQHKNLREAAKFLIKELGRSTYGSTIWMKLLSESLCDFPGNPPPHPSFKSIPLNVLSK